MEKEVSHISASSPNDDSFSAEYRVRTLGTSPFFSSWHINHHPIVKHHNISKNLTRKIFDPDGYLKEL